MVPRLALVVLGLLAARLGGAQQPPLPPADSTPVELRLGDGSILRGRVVAATDTSCTVATSSGVAVLVPRRALAGWRSAARGSGSRFAYDDPNSSRLFLAPTARTVPGGVYYLSDYYVFFPVVGYGVADWLTLSGGMSVLPGVPIRDQLFYFSSKIALVRRPSFNVAVGATYLQFTWSDLVDAWGGVAYGVTTLGGEDGAVTLGLGWPFASGGASDQPWMMGGVERRIANDVKLIAEGWKFPGSDKAPVIAGVRFMGRRLAADLGVMYVLNADMSGVAPWVDITVNW